MWNIKPYLPHRMLPLTNFMCLWAPTYLGARPSHYIHKRNSEQCRPGRPSPSFWRATITPRPLLSTTFAHPTAGLLLSSRSDSACSLGTHVILWYLYMTDYECVTCAFAFLPSRPSIEFPTTFLRRPFIYRFNNPYDIGPVIFTFLFMSISEISFR